MKKINSGFLFPLLALIILIFALSQRLLNLTPPLGKLLHPFMGIAQNGEDKHLLSMLTIIDKMQVKDTVKVFLDERKVPHIYAKNTADLYYAQGYVTASLRLWQMDFTTYAAAGRLSEIFGGKDFLDYDRMQRRLGIPAAAKRSLTFIDTDPETNEILSAYTAGVNAYIRGLNYSDLPLEYKILDYKPEPWSKLKSVLILKSMAKNMTGYGEDMFLSKMMLALGETDFNQLFPDFYGHSTPVMDKEKPLQKMAAASLKKPDYLDYSFMSANTTLPGDSYNPRLGSNSWAVSGKKTKSGFPILASDPHLNLSLPGIWLEMQLSAPGINVYGVSIPGTPAVTIGFNENIAWGITNGADDVRDWYKLKISADTKKYEFDGKWRNLVYRVEAIKRRGDPVSYDTIYSSIQGPVVISKNFVGPDPEMTDHALKWELQRPSNEFLTFIRLSSAKNYQDYREALTHYACPLQNFTFACADDTIAVIHQGKMAVKWQGEGRFILDGTKREHLSDKYIPQDSLPQLLNPDCNFVMSANQHPTYDNYPYYYSGFYSEKRANRLQKLLVSDELFDIKRMEEIQLDNTADFATEALPVLLTNIDRNRLNKTQLLALDRLAGWNGSYGVHDEKARLFELYWKNVTVYTWDEFRKYRFYKRPPDDYILLDMLRQDPQNKYFDRQETAGKESAGDIVTAAFITALNEYNRGHKEWGDENRVDIMHMTNMPALSRMHIPSAGHPDAVNAVSANWGPSWRMIVELGPHPVAYGIYPGGESGNPGSRYYDNAVNDWNTGKYYPLHLFMSATEAAAHSDNTWILQQ